MSDLCISRVHPGLAKPDNYHPPLIIDIYLPIPTSIHNHVYSYRKFASGDYTLLYNILSTYDWSCVYDISSVDAAVASLNAVVQDATEQGIPRGITNSKPKFPHWYSGSLRYYIKKSMTSTDAIKRRKLTVFINTFPSIVSELKLLLRLTDLDG
jgi:hypothetical protein